MSNVNNINPINPKVKITQYRPDIDGLRSFGVLPLLGYHFFPSIFPGGFIAVDIFFVISGYLISKIIFEKCQIDAFSFKDFYQRRITRIFPSLALVMFICLIAGRYILFPDEFARFTKHVLAGAGFSSNFLLLNESGYFDSASASKPLLHLWSLGIEEQFYIFFPLIIWTLYKLDLSVLSFLIFGFFISFCFNISLVHSNPMLVFYSPHTRAWELLTGAIIGYCTVYNLGRNIKCFRVPAYTNLLSIAGISLLFFGFFTIDASKPFPGYFGIIPVLGTLLIIISGENAFFNKKILSNSFLVWVGLISFPLYLWQWPIYSFLHILFSSPPPLYVKLLGILATITFSFLTYQYVELPVRLNKSSLKAQILVTGLIGVVLFGYILNVFYGPVKQNTSLNNTKTHPLPAPDQMQPQKNNGFNAATNVPNLENNAKASIVSTTLGNTPSSNAKFDDLLWGIDYENDPYCTSKFPFSYQFCKISNKTISPTTALIGDSHANHFYPGLSRELSGSNRSLLHLGKGGCPPIANIESGYPGQGDWCQGSSVDQMINAVANDINIKTVFLAANWNLYITGKRFYVDHENGQNWRIRFTSNSNLNNNLDVFNAGISKTLEKLKGKKVIFIKQIPELDFDIKDCLAKRNISFVDSAKNCQVSRDFARQSQDSVTRACFAETRLRPRFCWDPR